MDEVRIRLNRFRVHFERFGRLCQWAAKWDCVCVDITIMSIYERIVSFRK